MLPTGLQRHRKSGAYYLRRRIPTDLLTCYPGKKEIVFSLRTKDYRTAVERHRHEEARLTLEWSQKRERLANRIARHQLAAVTRIDQLTPEAIDAICQHAEAASLAGDEARRESDTPYTAEEIEDYQAGYAEAIRSYEAYYQKLDKPAMQRKVGTVMPLLLDIVGDKPIGTLRQTDLENHFEAVQNHECHFLLTYQHLTTPYPKIFGQQ